MVRKKWLGSRAKELIELDLENGDIPLYEEDMPAEDVYFDRPEYAEHDFEQFKARLATARERVIEKKQRAKRDHRAFKKDIARNQPVATNLRGEPRWEGSNAQTQLREDLIAINAGTMPSYTPKQLYNLPNRQLYREATKDLAAFRSLIQTQQRRFKSEYQYNKKQEAREKAARR